MAWHVEVDRDLCQGTGICASMAEHVFQVDGLKSRAVRDTVEPEDAIADAAECCPMEAITVRDQAGNLIAPQE